MSGTLRVHPRGFGFLEPGDGADSVFVPAPRIRGLIDGDQVTATATPDRMKPGALSCASIRLHQRTRSIVIGDVVGSRLVVDRGLGNLELALHSPVPADGTCVVARFDGDPSTATTATVLEDLGDPLTPMAMTRRILQRVQLPHDHDPTTVADGDRVGQAAGTQAAPQGDRRDLTGQLVVTIDADHSEDLDDAVAAASAPDGSLRVWVHIADVAEHVQPGTAVDEAARLTPTSVYLPAATRHMLPRTLSAQALSLIPQVERDVMTVELRIDVDGAVTSVDVYPARIRSTRRLSYTTAAALIAADPGTQQACGPDVTSLIRMLWAAACRLGVARAARGGADAWHSDAGSSTEYPPQEMPAHLLIERLMVATNEAVASWLTDRGMPVLARVHEAPDAEAVAKLSAACASMGLYAPAAAPLTPRSFAALAAAASAGGRQQMFWSAALSAFTRASYTTQPGGHFGLGSARYLHFTSPLRRYADLLVHRVVKAYLAGDRSTLDTDLVQMAAVINDVAQRAATAERSARRAEVIMSLRPRQVVWATVIASPDRGPRAAIEGTETLAMLHVDGMPVPPPGTRVRCRVKTADPISDRLELRLSR